MSASERFSSDDGEPASKRRTVGFVDFIVEKIEVVHPGTSVCPIS